MLLTVLATCVALIYGYGELERQRIERIFPGMAEYKAMQAEIASETKDERPKTATIGRIIR